MHPLRVYLADLSHTGNGVATEAMPLNVGLVAAHALQRFGAMIQVSLFKYPADLEAALRLEPPDVLGCSNYVWNSNLSYHFVRLLRSLRPEALTIFGGTNYPFDGDSQARFLMARPELDMHVFYEGELAFANIIERRLGSASRKATFDQPIAGVQFLARGTSQLMSGAPVGRVKLLDTLPSPYVTGLMDKFFDGVLTPLVETARGCPFKCNFCNAGDDYFTKVNQFSDDYIREEFTYIARKASRSGVRHVTLADNNFGMIPRDARTAELLCALQAEHGWPQSVSAWTGKNSKERVIDVTRLLGDTLSISMSVQSLDDKVLRLIKRDNIKLDHYRKIADELNAQGRPQHAEVIMPLPGETIASHLAGLRELLDSNVSRVFSHTLQMLHGTPYKDDDAYTAFHGYETRWRVVPLDFSTLDEGPVFDVEEVAVASKTLSFAEYVEARKYLLVIDLAHNSGVFEPLKKWLRERGIRNSAWVQTLYDHLGELHPGMKEIVRSFEADTRSELWATEKELVDFYSLPENYRRLVEYEAGGNVLFKHRVWTLTRASQAWVSSVYAITRPLVLAQASTSDARQTMEHELDNLQRYNLATVADWASPEAVRRTTQQVFDFDVPGYVRSTDGRVLADFGVAPPMAIEFAASPRTVEVIEDGFRRYGTGIDAMVKMLQRVPSLSFTRAAVPRSGDATLAGQHVTAAPQHGPGYSAM